MSIYFGPYYNPYFGPYFGSESVDAIVLIQLFGTLSEDASYADVKSEDAVGIAISTDLTADVISSEMKSRRLMLAMTTTPYVTEVEINDPAAEVDIAEPEPEATTTEFIIVVEEEEER